MKTKTQSFLLGSLAAAMISLSATGYADDTEIYFARANVDNQENKPAANVLFLIDTSGSMSGNRMRDLKAAFNQVVSGLGEDISVGVGRFNNSRASSGYGGYVFYPVTPMTESVKVDIKDAVSGLPASGNTPTHESYTEMVRYMLGEEPSNYAKSELSLVTEYKPRPAVNMKRKCDWPGTKCSWESDSRYESPINYKNQCESNHIIVMTDGAPTSDADSESRAYVASKTRASCSGSYSCQKDLAEWLYNNGKDVLDKNGQVIRKPIKTWQVGFQMTASNLRSMGEIAAVGGTEKVYNAQTAEALASAFIDILDLIDGQSRSTAAPGVAVNTMNRFQHLDELYYAVFQPAKSSYWEGNLKRYRLGSEVMDANNKAATDAATGYFKPTAQSFWSTEVDGADAQKGGARANVGTRKLFYSTATGGTAQLNWSSTYNQTPTNAFFGLSTNSSDRATQRTAMFERLKSMWGDPMHSVPLMVNYGSTRVGERYVDNNYVFVSNNGGMLHIINTKDGSEVAAFMPHELFEQAADFAYTRPDLRFDNTRPVWGLDGSWIAWRQAGAKPQDAPAAVYLYGGMRRGGQHYYALDVTNPAAPTLKWKIGPEKTGFGKLGQTWSTPTLFRMPTAEGSVLALVFGGGYSPTNHDPHDGNGNYTGPKTRTNGDAMGNTVYIVNAATGDLIWSASHADMKWSIPGGISVVDIDLDGVADHLYFGDLGGQLFRVDLDEAGASHTVHRIAELGGSGVSHRRFYEAPAVGYVRSGTQKHLYVAVASGYREHPLDETIDEGLFVVVDKNALKDGGATLATLNGMANVAAGEELGGNKDKGWYYLFKNEAGRKGEKAMSSPVIFDGKVMLATYSPEPIDDDGANVCAVRYGAAYLHTVTLREGNPARLNRTLEDPVTRSRALSLTTPPPTPSVLINEDGETVVIVGTEPIGPGDGGDNRLRKRRWMQLTPTQAGEILRDSPITEP